MNLAMTDGGPALLVTVSTGRGGAEIWLVDVDILVRRINDDKHIVRRYVLKPPVRTVVVTRGGRHRIARRRRVAGPLPALGI